jgi:amino acid adenylation domain-containing protein/non-ribosomal peptide synthase protein (TIGR01720 family)
MSRKNIENIYSLSPMQQGILFHALYDAAPGAYLVALAWTLRGKLDIVAFGRAWQEVLDRHTILRTAFAWERLEKPLQIVRKRVQLTIEEVDLTVFPEAERAPRAARFQEEFHGRGFDLTRAPLMRMALLRLGDDLHRFIWSSHHLLLDGWSLPVVVREAFVLYEAYAAGREVRLDRPRPYGEYIAWLARQDLGKAEEFWRKQLAGFTQPTPFHVDRLDVGAEEGFDERVAFVDEAGAQALQAFARAHELTISTVVLGAFALMLARYSGEQEILYGNTVSGRSAPVAGVDRMVGLFINTLPVRVKVPEGIGALDWLRGVQEQQAELRDYEFSPLVQVQGWSELPRGVPLFEAQVAFENYPSAETLLEASGGLKVTAAQMESQSHYPLTFNAASRRNIGLRLAYDKRRFDAATVDRMLAHLATLLGSIAREPERNVWELPMLPAEETKRLVFDWNDGPAPAGPAACVHHLFEQRVDRTPDALALVAGPARYSYRELEARSNRLARHLQKLGVGPDAPVALITDRTADLIVGILGVLKAGGAYVPIDHAYPAQRIAQIRDEAGVRVVVTKDAFAAAAEGPGVAVVRVDGEAAAIAAESDARPESGVGPAHLVYVLFTSGSTGKPKGVAIEHRNLVNYVRGVAGRLGLPEGASYAHISTFSADLGNTVLFPPLCLGGTLHVIPEELTTDPDGVGAYFQREGIDCLKIVPSHLSALLSGAHPERVIPRQLLVVGGEGSTWELVERVERLSPQTRVMNHYGPTETTVGVITHPVEKGRRLPGLPILPLGRPLPGSRVYVLDGHLVPTPTGVPGEIYVGGAGVARGYLGRPDLTEERFLADPFRPGERMYKTGDRGRVLPDGTILFLGRADFQVKIRGFRIELGEIEAALSAHVGVREAVVLAHDEGGNKRLCAYVVNRPAEGPSIPEMRAWLEQRLPEYMVPAAFSILTAIPLTPNGKIDRKALAAIEEERHEHEEEQDTFVAARNPIEEVLASIWGDVFDRESIGVHDKFADLGGHSLLAIQIIARTREAFQVDIPLRAIFEAPTIAGLAAEVESALHEAEGTPVPPLVPVPRDRDLALSFAQERLWFLHQLEPDSPFYNVPSVLRLKGQLDVAALTRALDEIVRRHEVLRTTFKAVDGRPVQVVHEHVELEVPVIRWPELSPEGREEAARAESSAEARRPFDLATGPMIRARLLVVGAEEHVLLLTLHHIVSDGWTRGILNRELALLYRAFTAGKPASLPEIPVQYADYAAWQRKWLSGDVLDRQIAYWKKQLDGAPQAIELPTDRPRPPVQTYRGSNRLHILPREVGQALKELARRESVTLYMVLLSGLDLLLHRWTGQRDVVVGTSVSNRNRAETERLVGFFINALVLRTVVDDDVPFTELLAQVRDVCLGAYAHQDMPFERLVQELSPEPDPSRAPLFQIIFTMQNAPGEAMALPGLELRGSRSDVANVKYDLTFLMGEGRDGALGISIDYNVDLFDGTTIDRMIGHLANLLTAVARDPSRKVADIPMLPAEERERLVVGWNDTAAAYSTDDCVHELFEATADATPDALAVASGEARLTFRELDARANRVAHHLRRLGVGPESVVGICLGRSVEWIVAMLGILKAGGAYVPLDPTYPAPRLGQLLEGAGARVVLSEDHLAGALVEHATVVRLDGDAAALAAESDARVESELSASNLAYVLFTSGSTGKPKGVAIEHRNLVNYVRGVAARLALPGDASYAHISTLSADLGNTVLFPPLCLGGTLHVLPEALTTDPLGLGAYFQAQGIDCLKIVPSHLSALLVGAHPERVLPRRLLVLGGEASSWELIERLQALAPELRIMNHYGPTETTVGVVTYPVVAGSRPEAPIVPLGRPLPNTQIYLLDAQLSPTPIGVPGEVYVGGAGVARGYLGQPELTRERFLADPFSGTAGARLYRTGDRARYLPDGTLVFLGRADFQVKIRGYRIELGEIEGALAAHVGIKDAVVLAQDDGLGNKRLVAYLVNRPMEGPSPTEAQAWLAARLPDYMVPAVVHVLDRLPLTPNGKIDRKALVEVGKEQDEGDAYAAPRTPIEEVLQNLWCDVFERDRIGIHERFNDLGGHSLLAIQIIARARDALGAAIPLRAIFEAPTIAGLAERIEVALREDTGEDAPPPIAAAPRVGPLPLSFAQERLWFLDRLEPGSTSYNIPARLRLDGPLDVDALERALREIVRRHEVLRTTFLTIDGRPQQLVHEEIPLRLPVEEVAGREAAVAEAAAAEMAAPFDLARGPLVRARLLRLAPTAHVLLLTMHHIVSDGWTKGVLYRELGALYEAFRAGRPSPLGALPLQYADFAAWQRGWLEGGVLDRQLAYWKQQLAGAPAALELPTDRPRPPVLGTQGARRRFALPAALGQALKELARREGATLFMTLLAAFDVLLHRWSGQDDVVVGTPTAGRTRPEIEPLIGFFVNTLVVRAHVAPEASFVDLLGRVREACLGAYAHQDVPFERLVADLAPERDLARTPIFQVMFTVQDLTGEGLRLPSLTLSGVAAETTTSKFDLQLSLGDSAGGLLGAVEYNADLFDPATVDRLIEHYRVLLEGIAAAPDQPVGALPLLPAAERHTVVHAWNDTAFAHPTDRLVHEIVAAQAAATPDAVAVSFEGAELTYRAFEERVNQLAHALRRCGVGPDVLVGVAMDRSLELVVALHGVLAAGGAYVPLDPEYPRDRLAFMLEDCRPNVIITQAHLAASLQGLTADAEILHLDPSFAAIASEPTTSPGRADLGLDHLAYVIYTSGSTGRPKGAMNEHRGLQNRLLWMQRAYGLTGGDRVLQKTPFSFDVSVWEFFWPLMSGARLVVARPGGHRDPGYLADLIAVEGVTTIHFVPSMLKVFVDEPAARGCRSLRRVICSGEALPPALADQLFALDLGAELHNLYGPTEAAIDVTAWQCQPGARVVPIGRPIDNVRTYVLDERGEPTPIGVPGELYLGGVQVGRGYLNRPELTAERFVKDPFSDAPGARLYRTGDVARWLPDGAIEYRGRTDFQVKIRGFRIELGEIEAALSGHPAVRDVVVVARADGGADARLVAYLVAPGASPTVTELRALLKDRLPEHMIPAAFVVLPALPLTASGKVDRRALPAPEVGERLALGEAFASPRSAAEEALCRIWADVLRLPRVGIHDNFFAIGGDSILSIQIVSRAQGAGIFLTPRQIFQHQTVAELGAVAGAEQAVSAEQDPIVGPVPLTPVQRWWLEQDQPQPSHHNQSFFLEAPGPLDAPAVEAALAVVLEHHDALRLRVARSASGWEQTFAAPGAAVPLRRIDLSAWPAPERAAAVAAAAAEAQATLDVAVGPVLRAVLFDAGEGQPGRVLFVAHHLAVDAVSWRVLTADFWSAYTQARRGAGSALPPKTTSYRRWAEELAERAASDALAAESAYWLAPERAVPCPVPVDHPTGDNTEASARAVVVSLAPEETDALLRGVPEAYRTQINDALLAALAQALAGWTGAPRALVDLEGHGREDVFADVDLTRTVGWFTAVFPVALAVGADAGPADALKAVKEQLRGVPCLGGAHGPGRGLGYGLLRYLRTGDDLGARLAALPQAEVSFNYLGQVDEAAAGGAAPPFTRALTSAGPPHGPENRRRYLLDVHGSVHAGRLHVRFTYSENRHLRATVEGLAARFAEALRALIAHCTAPGAGGYTPSDFPRIRLAQPVVDELAARAGGKGAIEDVHPLSPLAEGILFHALYAGDPGAYYVQLAWTIEGDLDVSAFQRAWQAVVDRHQVLRTAILWEGLDRPVALVHRSAALPFVEHDLRSLAPADQAAELDRFTADDRRRGFDLALAPLLRVTLLRLGAATWRFVWGSHHIVLDGWSMPILLKEALQLYEAFTQGREARLEREPAYTSYMSWLVAQDPGRAQAFWRKQLAGFAAPTPLPGEEARADRPLEARFGERRRRLSEAASAALSAFARRHQLTLSTLVQGAWAILLARASGEADVVFGSTVSGRSAPVPGIDRMVGLFINTLAVRAQVDPRRSALGFLTALQEQQSEMREHEHSALAEAQALSAVPRGTPLFESLVVFENQPVEESLRKGGGPLSLTDARAVERPAYPLTLQSSFRGTLLLRLGFDAARFDEAQVDRLLGHLDTLLGGIVTAPEGPIAALPLLTEAERRQVLTGWNDTAFAHPTDRAIHEIVAAQALATPDAVALAFEGAELSYRAFSQRVSQLAHALRRRGVGPDVLVGVAMDRSLEMVVALHGVLAAGGAYVPLDPEYPSDRLAFMLEDCQPRVILTQAHLVAALPPHGAEVMELDGTFAAIASEPTTPPARAGLTLESLAYVIYTSGSTGRPKGAMNEHGGILNRLLWMQHEYRLGADDRVLQKTPFSFDVSVWELFWPLMFGARLVVARPGGHREPGYLVDAIAGAGITTMHFVPSMLKVFLDEGDTARCAPLRRVFASGEALPAALVDRFYVGLPAARLHNLYGPTEAAVDVTYWPCQPGEAVVPIGRPVHNTRIYLLDDGRQPVPEGIRGELYIAGVQVGRGYLNRAELTAERFVQDPFAGGPAARMYRTGDVARWRADGAIEYLGRADFQVKLRGFRIELGEIEADLLGHPQVREAVVVARDEGGGDRRLLGYLVCHDGPKPTAGELRGYLKEKLPDYMVPAAFVYLEALPLTSSGKIDRRALPAPEEGERAGTGAAFVAPTSAVEEELCRIWASVLRLPRVGIHDNFFEVGGDSILSIQIVSRAQKADIRVTPRQIFEHPTIADLASVAGTRKAVAAEQGAVTGAVPLTPVERWWLDAPRVDAHHWNQSTFVEVRERVDAAAMERAVGRVLEHHDALRLRLARVGDAYQQTLAAPGGKVPFRVVDLTSVPAAARRGAIEEAATAAQQSLDLAEGPIVRVVLFDAGAAEPSRLLVIAHHLGVDGVSWRILLDDLWGAYAQTKRGLSMALPVKTTSWKRWAERLAEHARAGAMDGEYDYWLARPPAVAARLPVDLRRGDAEEASTRNVLVSLTEVETEQLLRQVPEAYRTQINDVLLTALAQAFAAWTGAPGALFDFEGHGREEIFEDADVTRTVGWFTTVYPVALELPSAGGPGAALKAVKEQLRAVPSRGLGYGLLRYLREDERAATLARAPAAEVSFNYLGQVDQALPPDAPFRWAEGPTGPLRSPRGRRRYLVDVNARVVEGRLHVWFAYSEDRHRRESVEALGARFVAALRVLVEHCLSPEARGHTPSDFADANLSQEAIDMLVGSIAEDDSE